LPPEPTVRFCGQLARCVYRQLGSQYASRAGHADTTAITDRIADLSYERFAKLIEIAQTATDSDPETGFHAGLYIILAGPKTQVC
jgi:hypothetical protein